MEDPLNPLIDWIQNTTLGQILALLFVLLVVWLIAKYFLRKLISRIIGKNKYSSKTERKKREDTLVSVFWTLLNILVWVSAVVGVLVIVGVNLTGVIAGAGIVGVAIGIGAQNVIKDYTSGMFIILEDQFRKGDIVGFLDIGDGSIGGVVEDVSLRMTKLRDLDGNLHFIPNGAMVAVTNRSFGWASVNIDLNVSYDSDLEKVKEIINSVGESMLQEEKWTEVILEPVQFLRVDSFGDSSVVVKALGKVTPANQWEVAGEFRLRIKKAFDDAGVEIPFPQRVVHTIAQKDS